MRVFPILLAAVPDEKQRTFVERMYLDYHTLMYAAAFRMLRHSADAEDAVQTAFMALCKRIPLLQGLDGGTLRAYALISVKNAALNLLRARGRRAEVLWSEDAYTDSLLSTGEDDAAFALIQQDSLVTAVRQLPEKDRALMEMKYISGLSDGEIARRFGIQKNSVRMLLTRFRKRLYDLLKEGESDAQR